MTDTFPMHIQSLPLDQVHPYAHNPRHNSTAVDQVAHSVQAFGFKQPIVVDRDHVIIVGHTRYLAAQQLGLAQVPVLIADDLTPEQAKAYRLADNRTHEAATWDRDLLAIELSDLSRCAFDLALTGFDADELAGLMNLPPSLESPLNEAEAGEVAVPDVPRTKSGDIWQLGRHRVGCGDSTVLTQVQSLLQGTGVDLIFIDPPYNVDYEGYTTDQLKMPGDHRSPEAFQAFLHQLFGVCAAVMKPRASLYVCHPSSYQREFQTALEARGLVVRNQLVWAKHHFAWGFGRYKFQHEPIFYCHVQGERDAWYGDKAQTTLWEFDKPAANPLHPTMKPVALIEKALKNSSQAGEVVWDGFGGSGSTLLACENLGRTAYLMEIDPHYVDVIIKRWETATGQTANLLSSENAA